MCFGVRKASYLVAVILFLIESADLLLLLPKIRLLEALICHRHYYNNPSSIPPTSEIEVKLCKIAPIQSQLAYVRGWQVFWDALPSKESQCGNTTLRLSCNSQRSL
jgi:hypothetical protein